MFLGKVVGTVWATRKDEELVGLKFQIVKHVGLDYKLKETFVVAVDTVQAGVGAGTRQDAWALLCEFTQSDALRKHARGVEEAMRAYARWSGVTDPAEIETWGIVGLLHDFDYEQNPSEETHLHVGTRVLRERGWPEQIIEAVASHADYMKIPRDTPLKKAIYACDEAVGFIGACAKVRPSKKVADLPAESVPVWGS